MHLPNQEDIVSTILARTILSLHAVLDEWKGTELWYIRDCRWRLFEIAEVIAVRRAARLWVRPNKGKFCAEIFDTATDSIVARVRVSGECGHPYKATVEHAPLSPDEILLFRARLEPLTKSVHFKAVTEFTP